MKFFSNPRQLPRASLIIFFAALAVRLIHLGSWHRGLAEEYLLHDGKYFDALASSILAGFRVSDLPVTGLTSTYTLFLFFCYQIMGHDFTMVRLVQIILGSFTCVGIYQLARDYFGNRAGWIAGGLAVFCGVFIYFDSIISKASLVNFLVVLTLWAFHQGSFRNRIWAFGLSGMALAVAILSRNNLILTLPFFVWAWFCAFCQKETGRRLFAWGGVVFLLTVAAGTWTVSQYYQLLLLRTKGLPAVESITTSLSGIHFFIGNQPQGNGTYKRVEGVRATVLGHVEDTHRIAEKELKKKLTYAEANRFWLKRTVEVIEEHPWQWGLVMLKKFFLVWNAYEVPNAVNYDYWRRYAPVLSLPLVAYGGVVPLALWGWIRLVRDTRPMLRLLKGFAAAYVLSLLLTFVTADYRLPLYPVWILFAAFATDRLIEMVYQNQFYVLRKELLLLLVFFLFSNYETYLDRGSYDLRAQKKYEKIIAERMRSPKVPAPIARVVL